MNSNPNNSESSFFQEWSIPILLTISAVLLSLYNINEKDLWVDEIFTAVIAHPTKGLIQVITDALATPLPSPPFTFVVYNLWMKVFGFSNIAIRTPAVIVGALSIPVIYLTGKILFNKQVGLISAFLLLISQQRLYFSREARYYPFLILFSLLTIYFLAKAIQEKKPKWWIWFTIITILNSYTFLTSFFVLAAESIYVLTISVYEYWKDEKPPLREWLRQSPLVPLSISALVVLLFFAPVIPTVLNGMLGPRGGWADADASRLFLSFYNARKTAVLNGGGRGAALYLYGAATLFGIGVNYRKNWRQVLLLVSIMVAPFIIIQVISPKHWFENKYIIFVMAPYLILAARGVEEFASRIVTKIKTRVSLSSPNLKVLLVMVFLSAFVISGYSHYMWGYRQIGSPWELKVSVVNDLMGPEDIFATFPTIDLLSMDAKPMLDLYFDPVNSAQEGVIVVDDINSLKGLYEENSRVIFHYQRKHTDERLDALRSWISDQTHVKLSYGGYILVYMGKDASEELLREEVKDFKSNLIRR